MSLNDMYTVLWEQNGGYVIHAKWFDMFDKVSRCMHCTIKLGVKLTSKLSGIALRQRKTGVIKKKSST